MGAEPPADEPPEPEEEAERELTAWAGRIVQPEVAAPDAIERTRLALTGYAAEIAALGARRVRMCATSASRDASNADEFRDMVRGTLGVAKDAPVGFRAIRLAFDLEGNLSDEERANLIRLTERYCVVYQTLRQPPPIAVSG